MAENSYTEENYLKAIYKLLELNGSQVNTNAIAHKLQTKAASVTDMLKKLAVKKLINYQKYKGVTLTEKGEKLALNIIRKHRLWEMFLVEKLNFKWDEVHDVAEQLEHVRSDKLVSEIDKLLGFPKVDPHGDPIPTSNGKIHSTKSSPLSLGVINNAYVMTGVVDHSPKFLQYLDSHNIMLGCTITIDNINDFDKSLEVKINKRKGVFISAEVAKNILTNKK